MFCNINAKWVEKRCYRFDHSHQTCLATNQLVAIWLNTVLWLHWMRLPVSRAIHGSQVTCCKTSLRWACKMRSIYRFCHKKKKPLPTFCNNFSQPASTWFVARQVWFVVGKTRNIVLQLVLQHTLGDHNLQFSFTIFIWEWAPPPAPGGDSDASVCISVRGASRLTKDLVSVHHSVHSPFWC